MDIFCIYSICCVLVWFVFLFFKKTFYFDSSIVKSVFLTKSSICTLNLDLKSNSCYISGSVEVKWIWVFFVFIEFAMYWFGLYFVFKKTSYFIPPNVKSVSLTKNSTCPLNLDFKSNWWIDIKLKFSQI